MWKRKGPVSPIQHTNNKHTWEKKKDFMVAHWACDNDAALEISGTVHLMMIFNSWASQIISLLRKSLMQNALLYNLTQPADDAQWKIYLYNIIGVYGILMYNNIMWYICFFRSGSPYISFKEWKAYRCYVLLSWHGLDIAVSSQPLQLLPLLAK